LPTANQEPLFEKPLIDIDRRDRAKAFRLVAFQAVMAVAIALMGLLAQPQIAIALLVGGAIGTAGGAWLAFVAFRPSGVRPAKEILTSFYIGEIGKILIVMIFFVLAFRQIVFLRESRNALMMFFGFFINQLAIVVAPLLVNRAA